MSRVHHIKEYKYKESSNQRINSQQESLGQSIKKIFSELVNIRSSLNVNLKEIPSKLDVNVSSTDETAFFV